MKDGPQGFLAGNTRGQQSLSAEQMRQRNGAEAKGRIAEKAAAVEQGMGKVGVHVEKGARISARFWAAPVLWRFRAPRQSESGRGLPHSKTLARQLVPWSFLLRWETVRKGFIME